MHFQDISHDQLQEVIKSGIKDNRSLKDISEELSKIYNLNKKEIYQLIQNEYKIIERFLIQNRTPSI